MAKSLGRITELPARTPPAFGVQAVYNIPLTANLDKVDINLTGTADVTGATTLIGDGISELITSVDLVGDGSTVISSVPFSQLVNGNIWRRMRGIAPAGLQVAVGAVATVNFQAIGTLDLKAFAALRPKDSALQEKSFRVLELRFNIAANFGNVVANSADVSVAGSTVALDVVMHETIELPDAKGAVSTPTRRVQNSARDVNLAGATLREYVRLTPGQRLRGLTVRTQTAAGVNADTVLSAMRVYVGNLQVFSATAAGFAAMNQAANLAARETGYYLINFTSQEGSIERLTDELDLTIASLAGADAYIEYDTLTAGIIKTTQWGHIDI